MNCLECRKPLEKGKYCSERCGNAYRVRMHRLKVSSDLLGEEVRPSIEGPLGEGHRDKDTVRDPEPDWHPGKVITSSNRGMVCPVCEELSLTHRGMCHAKDAINGFNYGG